MAPYGLVEAVGPLVRARDDDRLVHAVPVVSALDRFEYLASFERFHVVDRGVEHRNVDDVGLQHAAHERRVEQYARLAVLPYHVVEQHGLGFAVPLHMLHVERRAVLQPHGRKLGRIADQNQSAARAPADIGDQIVEQLSRPEQRSVGGVVRQHGCLVHDEHGVFLLVIVERKVRLGRGQRLLPVDLFMDRIGFAAGVAAHYFGGPSGRCQQHGRHAHLFERPYQSGDKRRFARSGIAVQDESAVRRRFGDEPRQPLDDRFLSRSWVESEILVNLGGDMRR